MVVKKVAGAPDIPDVSLRTFRAPPVDHARTTAVPRFQDRAAKRHQISLKGQCRTGSGLSDISERGCCISTNGMLLYSGSRLVVRPDGLEGLVGEVRWTDGLKAGLQFAEPLYSPVVQHVANLWRAEPE